ncbi:hypothetical protein CYCD_16430 [Tenuifilaceae bacterium CYCD]|nr:hypothetical protein CYCD_16430 [Tenuifilaceae bacterium CYCD]
MLKTIIRDVPMTILRGMRKFIKPAKTSAAALVPNAPVINPAVNPKKVILNLPKMLVCLLRFSLLLSICSESLKAK